MKIKGVMYRTVFLALLAFLMVFPFFMIVTNSFMNNAEIVESYKLSTEQGVDEKEESFLKVKLIPDSVVLKQYYEVLFARSKFIRMLWNSIFIVLPIVAFQVIISSMAAFAFAKLKFKGRDILFFIYIIIMLMPFQVTLVPNYITLDRLGLIDSYLSIMLPGIFGAFGVFLMRQFMTGIPNEYIEAAVMDGCSIWQVFFKIILPLSKGGIASLTILSFVDNWNMVEQPLIFIKDANMHPLSIYLSRINSGEMGIAFAASIIYMLPVIFIFLYGENYLVEGISHSAIKR